MFIRCAKCHGSLWLDLLAGEDSGTPPICEDCGQTYKVKCCNPESVVSLRECARYFAAENGIDLPGAFSVLLGMMTLGQVQDVGTSSPPYDGPATAKPPTPRPETPPAIPTTAPPAPAPALEAPPATAAAAPGAVESGRDSPDEKLMTLVDPAFVPAIEAGVLTPRQAIERGDRESFSRQLVQRHKMSEELAYAVADNKMSLLAAIRRKRGGRSAGTASVIAVSVRNPSVRRAPRYAVGAVVIIALIAAIGAGWRHGQASSAKVSEVDVQTDGQGRVVRVQGPDPRSVLNAYCVARETREPLEPLGLMPAAMESSRVRVGVLRDPSGAGSLLAISIRRSHDESHWAAGDGRAPLIALRAPDGARATFETANHGSVYTP